LGPYFYAQEYECQFGENTASLFSQADVRWAYEEEVELFDLDLEELGIEAEAEGSIEWNLV